MSVEMMREYIRSAYPGVKWSKKVDKMSDNRVLAVYNSLRYRGLLNKKEK